MKKLKKIDNRHLLGGVEVKKDYSIITPEISNLSDICVSNNIIDKYSNVYN